jgi:hypothetical protein
LIDKMLSFGQNGRFPASPKGSAAGRFAGALHCTAAGNTVQENDGKRGNGGNRSIKVPDRRPAADEAGQDGQGQCRLWRND